MEQTDRRELPEAYRHTVQYYETDKMGITHHSNYIRWMEEARVDYMQQLGFPYRDMEAQGIVAPVRAISLKYRRSCTFDDEITVSIHIEDFNGVVLTLSYDIADAKGQTLCTAASEHVFLYRDGRILRMKRDLPEFSAALMRMKEASPDM